VISRRALLGTGAAAAAVAVVAGAAAGHRLDDAARAVGIEPHPEPDLADDRLIARVARDQAALLAAVTASAAAHGGLGLTRFVSISRAHAEAVGASTSSPDVATPPADAARAAAALSTAYAEAAAARRTDSMRAVSPDLARVLASMSAGLAQCAHAVGELA
jgi:hypothetical protein